MRLFFVSIISCIFFSSCVAPSKILIHPDTGKQVICSAVGIGWLGAPLAVAMYADCNKKQEAMGYIDLNEYAKSEGSKLTPVANNNVASSLQPVWEKDMKWEYIVNGNKDNVIYLKVINKSINNNASAYEVIDQTNNKFIYDDKLKLCSLIKEGNVLNEYVPPNKTYEWPLKVGNKWKATGKLKTVNNETKLSTSYEVKD